MRVGCSSVTTEKGGWQEKPQPCQTTGKAFQNIWEVGKKEKGRKLNGREKV